MKVVQRLLRQHSYAFTADTYGDVVPELLVHAVQAIADAIHNND
jgi:hypothetical protein